MEWGCCGLREGMEREREEWEGALAQLDEVRSSKCFLCPLGSSTTTTLGTGQEDEEGGRVCWEGGGGGEGAVFPPFSRFALLVFSSLLHEDQTGREGGRRWGRGAADAPLSLASGLTLVFLVLARGPGGVGTQRTACVYSASLFPPHLAYLTHCCFLVLFVCFFFSPPLTLLSRQVEGEVARLASDSSRLLSSVSATDLFSSASPFFSSASPLRSFFSLLLALSASLIAADESSRLAKLRIRSASGKKNSPFFSATKEERTMVEKKYAAIKEQLSAARGAARETAQAFFAQLSQKAQLSSAALVDEDKKKKFSFAEDAEREKNAEAEMAALLDAAKKISANLTLTAAEKKRADECEAEICREKEIISIYFAKRKEPALLAEYLAWAKRETDLLKSRMVGGKESSLEARFSAIMSESESKLDSLGRLRGRAEPAHRELAAAIASMSGKKKKKDMRNDDFGATESKFVQEPVFHVAPLDCSRFRARLAKNESVWSEEEIANLLAAECRMDCECLAQNELEFCARDLAVIVAQKHAQRDSEDNDRLLQAVSDLFERAVGINSNSKFAELRFDWAASLLNWAALRCQMEQIIFKGAAIFPLLTKALTLVNEAEKKISTERKNERIRAIEALRKRAKNLDDCTSARMRRTLDAQFGEISELEQKAEKMLHRV